jgi:hypothetical protein
MRGDSGRLKKLYFVGISILIVQVCSVGIIFFYGSDILEKNTNVLKHTSAMTGEVLPGLKQDVGEVIDSTRDIKAGVRGLGRQVAQVGRRVESVEQNVESIGKNVDTVSVGMAAFIQDRVGLIWGHSLNPYVLTGLLLLIVAMIPITGRMFRRRDRTRTQPEIAAEAFTKKLEDLTALVRRINVTGDGSQPGPELRRIMHETERLINDARAELTNISGETRPEKDENIPNPGLLH